MVAKCIFAWLALGGAAFAQATSTKFLLPEFAFGGGWYSAVYFSNTGTTPVSFVVNFFDNNGAALDIPSLGGSSTTLNLQPRGSVIIEGPNSGPLHEGYVSASLPAGVVGYGVFRETLPGVPDQEAVVPLSRSTSTSSTLTWDETNVSTAVAILNPSSVPATVAITVWDDSGNLVATSGLPLAANSKKAVYLQMLPGLEGLAGKKGSAQFSVSSGNVAVLGLRFNGPAFTSIPALQQ